MKIAGLPKLFYSNLNDNNTNSVPRICSNNHVSFSGSDFNSKELSTDVVHISKKSIAIKKLLKNKEDIIEMRSNGLSQESIAQKYGVTRANVAEFLETYLPDVQSDNIVFRNAFKNYISANSEVERNNAFETVDILLQKIAADEAKRQNAQIYEDCLQDLRLKFFEAVKQGQEKVRIIYTAMLQKLKNTIAVNSTDSKNICSSYKSDIDTRQSNDEKIVDFEHQDLLKYLIDNSGLTERERLIAFSLLFEGKTIGEIGDQLLLTPNRIKQILDHVATKMNTEYYKISSNVYLTERLNNITKIMNADF